MENERTAHQLDVMGLHSVAERAAHIKIQTGCDAPKSVD